MESFNFSYIVILKSGKTYSGLDINYLILTNFLAYLIWRFSRLRNNRENLYLRKKECAKFRVGSGFAVMARFRGLALTFLATRGRTPCKYLRSRALHFCALLYAHASQYRTEQNCTMISFVCWKLWASFLLFFC